MQGFVRFSTDEGSLEEQETAEGKHDYLKSIPETVNFSKFETIDMFMEFDSVKTSEKDTRQILDSKYEKYKVIIGDRMKMFFTLTLIALTIGLVAGFLQMFTETLVNWKTGRCTRNWLLNKSFCCSLDMPDVGSDDKYKRASELYKRDEMLCIEQGLWVDWDGHITPFLIFVVLSVAFATISSLLVKYVAPMATGSGITEIKIWVSGFKYTEEFFSFITLITKVIALPLAISSGLSIGKEGPSVHYATCCGFLITSRLFKKRSSFSAQTEYLIAASGAGVAVAFGSPIGGVLFGLEEISTSTEFNASVLWKSYYVALIAVATLKTINPFRNGKIILFNVTYDKDWKVEEIPIFIILGIFGGLYGWYVSKWNISYVQFRRKYLSRWPIQEVVVVSLLTTVVSYFNEFLKLDMTESMGILFHECIKNDDSSVFSHKLCQLDQSTHALAFLKELSSLVIATVIRTHLVIMTYGAAVPAGIFVPSMAVGATFGRAISLIVERFVSESNIITGGTYAFLGAAAALSGITNLTLTVVVIMFELTGAFIYIIPTMIVVAMTRIVLVTFDVHGGISDQMIAVNGFPYLEDSESDLQFMETTQAKEIMISEVQGIYDRTNMAGLKELVYSSDVIYSGFPIFDSNDRSEPDKRCVGYLHRDDLIAKIGNIDNESENETTSVTFSKDDTECGADASLIDLSAIVNHCPVVVKSTVPASLLFKMFKKLGNKVIIVEEEGIFKGLITRKDLLRYEKYKHKTLFDASYSDHSNLQRWYWSILKVPISKLSRTSR